MHDLTKKHGWPPIVIAFIEIVVITGMVLFFGEIIPKTLALRNTVKVSLRNSWLIAIFYTVFFPITFVLYILGKITERSFKVNSDTLIEREEDIKTLVQIGEERGQFEGKETEMITSLLESTYTSVREIMIPRPDMLAVDASRSLKDIINFVANQPYARLPVFEDNLDNIIGFIFEKDILPYIDGKKETQLKNLLHPPLFLPEKCSVPHAITVFQEKKTKIAMVVDEYGGISGLVTLEDAIEQIVGDIQDENEKARPFIKWLTDDECAVNAAINLDDLEEILNITFPYGHPYDTLGGFVMDHLGRIPAKHDSFRYQKHIFVVDEMKGNRINRIRITKKT
jgi:CBS domain containing-hemolysin-like protein